MIKRTKSKKKELLSDKISSLFTVAPSADVEDDQVFGTKPKTVTKDDMDSDESNEERSLSTFRKQNVALLSELSNKYAGEVTSSGQMKKYLEDEASSDVESSDFENGAEADDAIKESDQEESANDLEGDGSEGSGDENESYASEGSNDTEGSRDVGFDLSEMDSQPQGQFTHIREVDGSEEFSKGNCVKNQLSVWESMLEARISLQKCLLTANKMPLSDTMAKLKSDGGENFTNSISKTRGNLTGLLTKLVDLQTHLFGQYPETKNLFNDTKSSGKNVVEDDDEEIPSDSDSVSSEKVVVKEPTKAGKKRKLSDISHELAQRHTTYAKYRNSVIQKWNDKTRLTMGNQKNQQSVSSTVSQIEFLLKDRNKLVKKTQLKRSKYEIVGQKSKDSKLNNGEKMEDDECADDEEYCTEIFDDDDFYHQLLRELIEYKSADISDPIQLSRQWIALQQLRSKMKRKIDTRATKGRRIRYAVHSKLVNFMAPQSSSDWTDESKNELFASLFGKQFEGAVENEKSDHNTNDLKIF